MEDNLKKELDQIGALVDSKIEKAAGQAMDNAKGEIEHSLKSEIKNLTEKFAEVNDRIDASEVAMKKNFESKERANFKGALLGAINDGALKGLTEGNYNSAKFEVKAAGDMSIANNTTGDVAEIQRIAGIKADALRSEHIRSLLPTGSTNAQTISYVKEANPEDGAAAVSEGSTLAKSDIDLTESTVKLEKIGTFLRITEEMINDIPALTSFLSARIPQRILAAEDNEILNGDGTTPNLDGLFTDGTAFVTGSGGAFYQSVESANEYDVLIAGLNQLQLSNYKANVILLNPTDLHKIVLLKSTANEYLKNQIYQGLQPSIAGVPIVTNTAVTAGKFLMMDSNRATQFWVRQNLAVEFSKEDSTNFRDGFVTVRATERVALTNYEPKAIVQGTFSTAKTALETA
jgi:HK97 family phage major capsid protein